MGGRVMVYEQVRHVVAREEFYELTTLTWNPLHLIYAQRPAAASSATEQQQ